MLLDQLVEVGTDMRCVRGRNLIVGYRVVEDEAETEHRKANNGDGKNVAATRMRGSCMEPEVCAAEQKRGT